MRNGQCPLGHAVRSVRTNMRVSGSKITWGKMHSTVSPHGKFPILGPFLAMFEHCLVAQTLRSAWKEGEPLKKLAEGPASIDPIFWTFEGLSDSWNPGSPPRSFFYFISCFFSLSILRSSFSDPDSHSRAISYLHFSLLMYTPVTMP